jgi:hypothetical protein
MNAPTLGYGPIQHLRHEGQAILEVKLGQLSFNESLTVLHEYLQALDMQRPGHKLRVLVDFEGAQYDSVLSLAWKARLEQFGARVERSAVVGASPIIRTAIQAFVDTADLMGRPVGPERAVIFIERDQALDWLARPATPPALSALEK